MVPEYMYNAANAFKIDIALLYAICKVESNCKPKSHNKQDSNHAQKRRGLTTGSYGMFQIKLATAKSLGFVVKESRTEIFFKNHKQVKTTKIINHADELFNPEVNTWYAAKLLRHLFNKYHDTAKTVSAYNAGRYITTNTRYVNKVLNNYANYKMDKRF